MGPEVRKSSYLTKSGVGHRPLILVPGALLICALFKKRHFGPKWPKMAKKNGLSPKGVPKFSRLVFELRKIGLGTQSS